MTRSAWIIAAVAAAQIGCATAKPITPEIAETLRGKRVALTSLTKKPSFVASTPGKAMFGLIGAAAMISAGNEIVEKNQVEDPAAVRSHELLASLRAAYGVVPTGAVDPGDETDVDALAEKFPNEDLLLDVRTTGWQFVYFPLNWTHYRVIYAMRATLYDLKNRTVLVAGAASRVPDQTPESPTYDELLDANAARLKAELKRLSDECLQDISRGTFNLGAPAAPAQTPAQAPAPAAAPSA